MILVIPAEKKRMVEMSITVKPLTDLLLSKDLLGFSGLSMPFFSSGFELGIEFIAEIAFMEGTVIFTGSDMEGRSKYILKGMGRFSQSRKCLEVITLTSECFVFS